MFTPSNQKKLTNVSIISLKKYNKIFSIPVYPNKLYEYHHKISPLSSVLACTTVYKNVQTGVKCSKEDLALFKKPLIEIIQEIVDTGHEQKNVLTREYEMDMVENQVVDILSRKVMINGKYVSTDVMKQEIKRVYKCRLGDIKPQVLDIINILVNLGYERVRMKIQVDEESVKNFKGDKEYKEGFLYISSGDFISFREYCKENDVRYIVKKNIENNEEEII
ncbi:hypothetical protein P3W45_001762 [Vairimorpha bombi]|jgi:ribosome maturation protein SDO1